MRQIALLVEGQTEERVVSDVLAPVAWRRGAALKAIVVRTSAGHHGGGSWGNYRDKLRALLRQTQWDKVGLLLDFYGYPSGAPGRSSSTTPDRESLMRALTAEYPSPRFRPLVVPHEAETWVLAAIDAGAADGELPPRAISAIRAAITEAGGAEAVNSRPDLAPSKRLGRIHPGYLKVVNGPQWIAAAGLDAILERCPVLAAWWRTVDVGHPMCRVASSSQEGAD